MTGRPPCSPPVPGPLDRGARHLLLAVAAATCLLAGCAASAPMRYHTLAAVAPTANPTGAPARRASDAGPVLQVAAVRVPPALDREELVREAAPGQFEIREFDHWAAPLARLARQALAEDLAARLPAGRLVFPGASWPAADAVLSVDILAFDTHGDAATMLLSWSVRWPPAPGVGTGTGAASAHPPRGAQLRLETRLDARPSASAGDAGATARAWNDLLAQLADRIVADLGDESPAAVGR